MIITDTYFGSIASWILYSIFWEVETNLKTITSFQITSNQTGNIILYTILYIFLTNPATQHTANKMI